MDHEPKMPENTNVGTEKKPAESLVASDLARSVEDLTRRIQEANKLHEAEVNRMIAEHENLAANQAKAFHALQEAHKQLNTFIDDQKTGAFQDQASLDLIEQLRATIEDAGASFRAAEQRTAQLFAMPEVKGQISDSAFSEREKELAEEKEIKECFDIIDQIVVLTQQIQEYYDKVYNNPKSPLRDATDQFNKVMNSAFERTGDADLRQIIERIQGAITDRERFDFNLKKLELYKANFGMFDGTKKRLVTSLLSDLPNLFNVLEDAQKKYDEAGKEMKDRQNKKEELIKRLRQIYWTWSNKGPKSYDKTKKINQYSQEKLGASVADIRQ